MSAFEALEVEVEVDELGSDLSLSFDDDEEEEEEVVDEVDVPLVLVEGSDFSSLVDVRPRM